MRALALAFAALVVAAPSLARADDDPWVSSDKTAHFGVSAAAAAGSYGLGAWLFEARGHAVLFAGSLVLTAGATKELADLAGAGTPSWRDFTWDAIGTLSGLAVAWSIDLLIRGVSKERPLFY